MKAGPQWPGSRPGPDPARHASRGWAAGLVALLFLTVPAVSDPRTASQGHAADRVVDGLIVTIPPTITSESINRLRSQLQSRIKRFEAESSRSGGTFTVLCDFNPDGRKSEWEEFGTCYDLARLLRSLPGEAKGVRTVAYVHAPVRRHSVLPVLACGEIVLAKAPDAGFGKVASGNSLTATEKTGYDEITLNRFPPALIRKMYDPSVEVIKAGDKFVDAHDKPRPRGSVVHGLGRGDTAFYIFDLAREVGLCQPLARNSLEEVRAAYNVPRAAPTLAFDRSLCWQIPVEGVINPGLKDQVRRRVERALRHRAGVLILELSCGDGESESAYEIGRFLAGLNADRPDNPVETIAYVTNRARNTAAFLAFACDKIVMQRELREGEEVVQRQAVLGGFERYLHEHPSLAGLRAELDSAEPARKAELHAQIQEGVRDLEQTLGKNLADLAERTHHSAVLAEALVRRDLEVHVVQSATGEGARTFLSAADLKADQEKEHRWRDLGRVKSDPPDESGYLTLRAEKARELGVAAYTVKNLSELFETEGLSRAQVRKAEADWLDSLADFLRDPWTSVILVLVGLTCLILELKMPGVGLPGVIAAICFVLFFWAHSQLNGQIIWLGVLLFVLGLLLLGVEIFVLPGFGVCGVSGTLLVLVSLGLVAYGHWPRTSEEWVGFGQKLGPFGFSLLGSLVCVVLLARYIHHIPILNRLAHKPPEEEEAPPALPGHAEMAALLGAIGVAATPLRPAGKVQFGDSFVDVVADGGYIVPGTRVQVIEVEGNRVVVKEV